MGKEPINDILEILEATHDTGTVYNRVLSFHLDYGELVRKSPTVICFHSCDFEGGVSMGYTEPSSVLFEQCTFAHFSGEDVIFPENVQFRGCQFRGMTNFNRSIFRGLAEFWRCTFHQAIIFYETEFLGFTIFSASTFKENALFTYSLIEETVTFRGTRFNKGLDLSGASIRGKLNLFHIKLDFFEAYNVRKHLPKRLSKNERREQFEILYDEAISNGAQIPVENQLETYRIIRKQFQDDGSVVALQFKVLENRTLHKLLIQRQSPHFNTGEKSRWHNLQDLLKWFRGIWSILILFLNRISNDYGQSYIRGILFTSIGGFLLFSLSVLGLEEYTFPCWRCWEWNWDLASYYFQFLLPTHRPDYIKTLGTPETAYYAADFAGRVFVSYGIYQTIQAFRKYK